MPRAVRFYGLGGPEVLRLEEMAPAEPGPGEVRLRVEAFGLNNSELQFRRGDYPLLEAVFPSRLGKEAVGVIEALGPGVTGVETGQRVTTIPCFEMGRYGVYGDSAVVPAHALAPYPEELSAVEAAAIWQQYLTVYGPFVEYALVDKGDVVLVTAASSSVGHAAIQISRLLGARPIATTRSAAKRGALLERGAEHVVVTSEEDLVARAKALTDGRGVDLVFDPVAGPGVVTLAEATAQGGTIVIYGALDRAPAPLPLITMLKRGLTVRGYTMWEVLNDPARLDRGKQFVLERVGNGELRPHIDRIFQLEEIVEAHRYMESSQQNGKVVVIA
jgi:NADPH:quinone reductase-like Zn-dependent oxidoreductase